MCDNIQCAAYYFPGYHGEVRNEAVHGKNWSEWELMKCARSRFPGHQQPKVPLHGYGNEDDPLVMAQKIQDASTHGLDAFVFDWYWYDGPYLQGALDRGFLQAENNHQMKFALMWANHDWRNMHPGGRDVDYSVSFRVTTNAETICQVWKYIIEKYLSHPLYWRVDGKLYFSIYAVNRLILQLGGVPQVKQAVETLREMVRQRGLGELHLNGIWYDMLETDAALLECPQEEWVTRLGFDSYTSYNNAGITGTWKNQTATFPWIDYQETCDQYFSIAKRAMETLPAPYYPVMTVGWDSTPRTIQSDVFQLGMYPWYPVMQPTPEIFENAIAQLRDLILSKRNKEKTHLLFFNAWNEWSEGSYLEPDTRDGYAYLDAIKKVFQK